MPTGAFDQAFKDYAATGANAGFNAGDYNRLQEKPGESYDQWMQRINGVVENSDNGTWADTPFSHGGGQGRLGAFRDYLLANKDKYKGLVNGGQLSEDELAAQAEKQKEAEFQAWRMSTMQRLDAFSKEMGMPVEQLIARGDLGIKNAGNTGRNLAGTAAYGAGLGDGGISNLNTQRAVTDAQSKYQMQRQQMGLNATQGLLGEMGNMSHDREDTRRYEQGMNMSLQQAQEQARQMQFAQKQQQNSQLWGTIGGVAGGIYGGPAGAAAGQALGSGLGGQMSGTYKPTYMQYPSGRPTSGGLGGGNRYGGSQ